MTELPDPSLARVLAAPMRRRVFDLVAAAAQPVSVSELTDELGCNHNAVRQHLARLREAGLVHEVTEERTRPGRPRLLYRATPPPDPYARLARLLLALRSNGNTPRATGREQGRADAVRNPAVDATDAVDALEADARRNGFAPRRVTKGRRVELVLDSCPLADAAVDDPRTVCAIHRGLAEGLVDAIGGAQVEHFTVRDPHAAGCRIVLRRTT